jgi:hypothetical protein
LLSVRLICHLVHCAANQDSKEACKFPSQTYLGRPFSLPAGVGLADDRHKRRLSVVVKKVNSNQGEQATANSLVFPGMTM